MTFTDEMIDSYADKLLIGLTDEERKMIKEEFSSIEKNMDVINEIPNIKDVEPLSFPYEMEMSELRSDEKEYGQIPIEELLQNCDCVEGREVEIPKVVGNGE